MAFFLTFTGLLLSSSSSKLTLEATLESAPIMLMLVVLGVLVVVFGVVVFGVELLPPFELELLLLLVAVPFAFGPLPPPLALFVDMFGSVLVEEFGVTAWVRFG